MTDLDGKPNPESIEIGILWNFWVSFWFIFLVSLNRFSLNRKRPVWHIGPMHRCPYIDMGAVNHGIRHGMTLEGPYGSFFPE